MTLCAGGGRGSIYIDAARFAHLCKSADNKRAGTPARCGEITLGADIKQSITIPEGRTLTLDLNGHTLTNSEGGHTVTNYGTLTIKDGSAGSNGAVDNISGGRGALVNYGRATVNSGSIVRGEDAQGSWYVIKNYGYMTLGKDAGSPVKVDTNSDGSSLIANGYYDAADKGANAESITVTENACTLVVNGGTYTNGMNTVLAAACASIEAKIAESEKTITTAMTEMLETMRKDIDGLESAISGGSADTDKLESALAELGTKLESVIADNRTAYEAALEETGSELKAAIAAIEADVEKLAGSVGSLADGEDVSALAGDIPK